MGRLYWICQVGGWTAFVAYQMTLYYFVLNIPQTSALLLNGVANIMLGIVVTHAYRMYIHLMGWLELPLPYLIPRVILGVISMAIVMAAINIPLDAFMFPGLQLNYQFASIYGMLANWSKYILVWALIYHLFQYYRKSIESEKHRYLLEAKMKETEYRQLKAQLNPHFLFNSLNSIRALVEADPKRARQAITQLSELLRSSLKMGEQKWVSLADELITVKDYLSLEAIRFEHRLQYLIDASEDTLTCKVPPMMLQTLVENGIKHGISKRKAGGKIILRARRISGQLHIEIRNSGAYDPIGIKTADGYGLANTRQRLEMLYDGKAKFQIDNTPDEEVLTQIILPL
jgi:two-component system, LytTR family, sensor kinase